MSFVNSLRTKQELLRTDYENTIVNSSDDDEPQILSDKDISDFDTMCRWHKNSHMTECEWLRAFQQIADRLDVKEKMESPSEAVISFLRYFGQLKYAIIFIFFLQTEVQVQYPL